MRGARDIIGSHVNKMLHRKGYETVVFDNLVYGHREAVKWGAFERGDLKNPEDLERVFQKYDIEAVMHFAAYAYVGESVQEPEKYYYNNVANTLNLLHAMRTHGCDKIIFSSTCATYGVPEKVPIQEAFKTLRTNIDFSGENIRVICITSALPGDGKSTVSYNLARAFAESRRSGAGPDVLSCRAQEI